MVFIGEYTHTFDDKKRVSLPSKFRKDLGKKVVVTHGLDTSLLLYPLKVWEVMASKLGSLSMGQPDTRAFGRFMLAGAVLADVDSIGRILIPEFLRKFANLKGKVVFAGVYDRIEIWDEKNWSEYKTRIEKNADAMAEKLGEIGVF
ncbi:MAG: division/cell wall cluster transcriptional repressor MraZ [Candidatus Zambryskibacteria bacterium CG_4_9_14_3_um_filter_40_16]|uniref:Transcriptional regulator MraZ n=2 Tax=Candidatus Zambryskiibacteriota TaxID=1817925 RepID=A0A2H0K782_9BACT|nr:MAG: division/cell wall cluster transcriptional repressor MraZ [Candidatus Zambryskibacteria bacterium CG11_big_fil_rev_8_21_14_0_20_40_24]PJA34001.1 MAG: division/cell wall cluster transcriptional repressor MraZ [Candidatus Zambryskibacteria bacterium CG_4_9_14_3_um_filter_40_16]